MLVKEIITVSLILFSVIDIIGNIPLIISLKEQGKKVAPLNATVAAGVLMVLFLFAGESILHFLGLDVGSFAIAGAIILLILGLEMVMNINLFKEEEVDSTSVFPIAFPMIAGAGTLTTILTLKAEYETVNIGIGIALNLILVFLVLRFSGWIRRKIGKGGTVILRKIFGIILLAIAIKLFKENWIF